MVDVLVGARSQRDGRLISDRSPLVIVLVLVPSLQRVGIVTASAIGLAFVATLTVLPALIVARHRLRTRRR